MSKNQKLSRRMFLKGAGGFSLAIPFLPSLLPRQAWGQNATPIKRYFNIVGGYDYGHHQNWFPTLNELPNVMTPANGDATFRYQTLRSLAPNSNSVLAPIWGNRLNPFLGKTNIFRGLNLHTRIAHGQGHMLGNIRATDGHDNAVTSLKALPTIDQVLASTRSFTPYSNDPLHNGNSYSFVRDAAGNVSRLAERWVKPNQLFTSLFTRSGSPIPEGGAGSPAVPPDPRRETLTRVLEDYTRIRNGRNISTTDRQILDATMDRYSDILSRLSAGAPGTSVAGCRYSDVNTSQSASDGVANGWYYNPEQHRYAFEMYARIYAAAASCDLHRVFNFHRNIPDFFDRHSSEDFHQGHSHLPFSTVNGKINHQYMGEIWGLYATGFLIPLLTALDSFPEANGRTILDNSLVHMTLESSTVHNDNNKPCIMIGSAAGALSTGYYIDYSQRSLGPCEMQGDNFNKTVSDARFGHGYHGIHYNRSLVTVLKAMGLSENQYEDPTINTFFQNRNDNTIGSHNRGITRVGGYGHIGSTTSGVWYYNNDQLYSQEYARQNYHFYKNSLPLPPSSAT